VYGGGQTETIIRGLVALRESPEGEREKERNDAPYHGVRHRFKVGTRVPREGDSMTRITVIKNSLDNERPLAQESCASATLL
jgi:hypothetical protein